MKNEPLTQEQYTDREASVCPMCRSEDIESEDIDQDGGRGTANCQCHTCGSYWVDFWHVVSYDNLNEGMTSKELKGVEKRAKDLANALLTSAKESVE